MLCHNGILAFADMQHAGKIKVLNYLLAVRVSVEGVFMMFMGQASRTGLRYRGEEHGGNICLPC